MAWRKSMAAYRSIMASSGGGSNEKK